LKRLFDQTRPDRLTVLGQLHGIPFSGKRLDAFHALHIGALASAAGGLSTWPRRAIRAVAVGLSLTRIVVLAHWRCCQNVLQWHASTTPVAFGVEIARACHYHRAVVEIGLERGWTIGKNPLYPSWTESCRLDQLSAYNHLISA
jgi:hypothetical protein